MVAMCVAFTTALQQPAATEPRDFATVDLDVGDLVTIYDEVAAETLRAWQAPGWADATLALPFGEVPGALALRIFVGDQLIHAWDLATAVGIEFTMPDDLATEQLELMQRFYDPESRGPDRPFDLATDCPPGASAADQLIALSGRTLWGDL